MKEVTKKAGDKFVTVERVLLALALGEGTPTAEALKQTGATAQKINDAINATRKGRTADSATAEQGFDSLKKYARDLTEAAQNGKLDPRNRPATRKSAAASRSSPAARKTIPSSSANPAWAKPPSSKASPNASSTAMCRTASKTNGSSPSISARLSPAQNIAANSKSASKPSRRNRRRGRRNYPLHRRTPQPHGRGQRRRRDGRRQHAQTRPLARRSPLRRRHHAR